MPFSRPGRRRGSRVSLPNLGLGARQDSTSSLKFNLLPGEWRNVFNSLDKKVSPGLRVKLGLNIRNENLKFP